ncbi:MAG TPA: hypothetical protein VF911_11295 [Thermoanaerobaculia bacterium]|jgi:hypothetical protein
MANRPGWYNEEHDNAWTRVKAAFSNDWEQTKKDFGSDSARELNQDVDDTLKQAAGSDDAFENREQAFRFGHAAQSQYGTTHPSWNADLESKLREDYGTDYDRDRDYIRHAYDYR